MTSAPRQLILASGSPRRRELLGALGVPFEVVTADVRELTMGDGLGVALGNARIKVAAVREIVGERWILGADTVVALDGRILGKPASLAQAAEFIRMLSGRAHDVITGCALAAPGGHGSGGPTGTETFYARTRVTFLPLSEETIARYLAAVHVLDKAGAYALQQHGDWIIDRVEGSRTNVIGLPTEILKKVLLRRGLLHS